MYKDLTIEQQGEVVSYILDSYNNNFKPNSTEYRDLMVRVYEALSTFEMPDTGDILTRFKVNKAHEIVNKVTPRIFAKSPKFIVTPRTDAFYEDDVEKTGKDRQELIKRNQKLALAVQDYLTVLFEDQDLQESLKLWAKSQVVYGNAYAQVVPKIEIKRNKDKSKKVNEKLVGVKPTIDVLSWTEMYYDPRYKKLKDMPGYIRLRDGVRLQELHFVKGLDGESKYFNLDKLKSVCEVAFTDSDSFKSELLSISGVSNIDAKQGIDANNLSILEFEGKYSFTGDAKDEKLYRLTVAGYTLIGVEEITQYSIVDIKAHEDVELFFSTGFVAPILGLQDELNFQKNAYATSISKSLNRSYYWSPDSGVDPSQLVSDKPGNIIVCADGVEQAQRNLVEVPDRPITNQYFNNVNDYNRDINNLTHTTDVSGQSGQTSQINTATGAKIAFFESNSVIGEVRKNFERGARELAYKILQWSVDNLEDNIVIERIDGDGFLEINKEALKDAIERYSIRIEAGSSSYDEIETRRNEAIALKNIMVEAVNSGADINITEGFKEIFRTFEGIDVDKLFKKKEESIEDLLGLGQGQVNGGNPSEVGKTEPRTPENLTQEVAGGILTEGI